jgi:hypothetical protein
MKKRFEKPQPQAAINQAFSEAIGQPVMVRFLPDHIVSTPNNEQADNQDLEALVKTAKNLGGHVVE